jgi:hypothetical protein
MMERFVAVEFGWVARKVRDVNGLKKAVKDWKPFLHYLFGYRGCEGRGEVPEEICARRGMISPIRERECLLMGNMLRLCFHSE